MSSPLWTNLFSRRESQNETIISQWLATPLFFGLNRKHCRALMPNMQRRHYQKGETIFKEGDTGIGVVLVFSGEVLICANNVELANLSNGDFFGEVALVNDEPRTADAIAKSDCDLVFFLRPHLYELMSVSPKIAAQLTLNIAKTLATRLRKTNQLAQQDG